MTKFSDFIEKEKENMYVMGYMQAYHGHPPEHYKEIINKLIKINKKEVKKEMSKENRYILGRTVNHIVDDTTIIGDNDKIADSLCHSLRYYLDFTVNIPDINKLCVKCLRIYYRNKLNKEANKIK